jgi:hypothetical protein
MPQHGREYTPLDTRDIVNPLPDNMLIWEEDTCPQTCLTPAEQLRMLFRD